MGGLSPTRDSDWLSHTGAVDDPRQHAGEHRVRFDECDAGGAMRPSSLLRAVQDLAWQHSRAAGFDRDWYAEHGLTWLVRFVDLRMDAAIESGSLLRMTTRISGLRRVWARRETRVRVGDDPGSWPPRPSTGSSWTLRASHRACRRRSIDGFDQEAPTFTPARVHLAVPPLEPTVDPWIVGVRDLDPMAHVNNATYLDIMDEVMAGAAGAFVGPHPPVRYEVEYLRSAMPRSVVAIRHWPDGASTTFQLTDEGGAELIRARVEPG